MVALKRKNEKMALDSIREVALKLEDKAALCDEMDGEMFRGYANQLYDAVVRMMRVGVCGR